MNSPTCHTHSLDLLPLLARIALQHLFLHGMPDEPMELDEARREADFRDIPWARQIDLKLADRPRLRAGRKDDHAIGQRDRLLEVVSEEHDGLAVRRPELEKLV